MQLLLFHTWGTTLLSLFDIWEIALLIYPTCFNKANANRFTSWCSYPLYSFSTIRSVGTYLSIDGIYVWILAMIAHAFPIINSVLLVIFSSIISARLAYKIPSLEKWNDHFFSGKCQSVMLKLCHYSVTLSTAQ